MIDYVKIFIDSDGNPKRELKQFVQRYYNRRSINSIELISCNLIDLVPFSQLPASGVVSTPTTKVFFVNISGNVPVAATVAPTLVFQNSSISRIVYRWQPYVTAQTVDTTHNFQTNYILFDNWFQSFITSQGLNGILVNGFAINLD